MVEGDEAKLNQGNKVCRDGRDSLQESNVFGRVCHKVFFQKGASLTPTVCQEGQTVGIILYHIIIILYYIIFYHVILRRRARSEEV